LLEFLPLDYLEFDYLEFGYLEFGYLDLATLGISTLKDKIDTELDLSLFFDFDKEQFKKFQVFVHKYYSVIVKEIGIQTVELFVQLFVRFLMQIDLIQIQTAE